MGPQLMNCCKLEQVEHTRARQNVKTDPVLEDGRVPAKEAKTWKIEGQKKITRTEYQRLIEEF